MLQVATRQFIPTLKTLLKDTANISLALFRIMIPIMLVVKLLKEWGLVGILGEFLAPVMELVGLPGSMGLVWATTMLTNLYDGIIVYVALAPEYPLSVAQVSVLCSMMLIAHNLPVEVAIAKATGVNALLTTLVRFVGAILYGILLYYAYEWGQWFDGSSQVLWQPEPSDSSWLGWALGELKNLAGITLIIFALLCLMKLFEVLKLNTLLANWVFGPLLRLCGIGKEASILTVTGMLLGLAYGGGIIIREAKQGHIGHKDIFAGIMLMSLCHSLVEDTLLMLLLGSELYGILLGRLVFAMVVTLLLVKLIQYLPEERFKRYCYRPIVHPS